MQRSETPNAVPVSGPQMWALLSAATRQLAWGLRGVSREVRAWHRRARAIPDPRLRSDALDALEGKRGQTDGAALFWTLHRKRDVRLLRTLVAFELLQDFLDCVSERAATAGVEDNAFLYGAIADALDPSRAPADYYRHCPWKDDAGYLAALVMTCQAGCRALPSHGVVRPLLAREAERAVVLAMNHEPDAGVRDAMLQRWAQQHLPDERAMSWFELTAAVSGFVTTHLLLALAARSTLSLAEAEAAHASYFPWLTAMLTMLDSYADLEQDLRSGEHSYIAHYENVELAVERLTLSIRNAARAVLKLPDGERHGVLLGCMIALYLSKDSVRTSDMRPTTARLLAAGGDLPRLLLPILRLWRVCNAQRALT